MPNISKCSFCGKEAETSVSHNCSEEIYKLLNSIAQPKDGNNLFNEIDNLVFQGGGVKGISYLGVVQQLLEQKGDLIKNVKRIAGTSAGSLITLYLGLNMNLNEISKLLSMNYVDLLDTDFKLKVCKNPTNIIWSYKYISPPPSTKLVFLSAIKKFSDLKERFKTDKEGAEDELTDMISDIIRYFAIYQGSVFNIAMGFKAHSFAEMITKWLIGALTPDIEEASYEQPDSSQLRSNGPNTTTYAEKFRVSMDNSFNKASERVKAENNSKSTQNLQSSNDEQAQMYRLASQDQDVTLSEEKVHLAFYSAQKSQKLKLFTPQQEKLLNGKELHYSIAEMIWFLTVSHELDLGLFSANLIKQELIEKPIKKKMAEFKIVNENPTFADLASYKDEQGNHRFKDIYITSFNAAMERTEVFSASSTPNVVVADAVRASMSIPIFFTPVTIRDNGKPRQTYTEGGRISEPTRYMDGGILDNYPIWIFDDLRFCLEDKLAAKWAPKYRLSIQNPRTMGFRIMDRKTIDFYVQPYFDKDNKQLKRINEASYSNSLGYMLGALMGGFTGHEENSYINQGNCPRSAYINNLGISAISFNLTQDQKDALIREGKFSVKNYISRAQRTGFVGEGQAYNEILHV